MIVHLFKGAVIFETLLKRTNKKLGGDDYGVLEDIFGNGSFLRKYPEFKWKKGYISQLSDILKPIHDNEYTNTISKAFNTVYRIRNSATHKLSWEDIFTLENYMILYSQVIYAILFIIKTEYISSK